jgi:hypothetical protein
MLNPGQNSTSWQSGWNYGKTQTIRVPIALASQVLEYAKALDQDSVYLDPTQCEQTILRAIDSFAQERLNQFHPNQYKRTGNTTTRRWDELRKFRQHVADGNVTTSRSEFPKKITLRDDMTQ